MHSPLFALGHPHILEHLQVCLVSILACHPGQREGAEMGVHGEEEE